MIKFANRTEGYSHTKQQGSSFGFVLSQAGSIIGVYLYLATFKQKIRRYVDKPSYEKKTGPCRLYVFRQLVYIHNKLKYLKNLQWVPMD